VLLVLPDSLGEAVLGDSWKVAEPLLLATGAQIVFLGLMTGPRAGLLGMRAINRVMLIDVATTVLVFAASIAGAAVDGALGAVWAITAVQAAVAVAMWGTFLAQTRRYDATGTRSGSPGIAEGWAGDTGAGAGVGSAEPVSDLPALAARPSPSSRPTGT
jgi:O-antigen/teichoic acid export membrane protein